MALPIITLTPFLDFLNTADQLRLKQVNKECEQAVRTHMQTQTIYTVRYDPELRYQQRALSYELYPNVKHLTFECHPFLDISHYLRASLISLTLILPLQLSLTSDVKQAIWLNRDLYRSVFTEVQRFLDMVKESNLLHLRIELHPEVKLHLTIPDDVFIENDANGPVYEDRDWVVKTKMLPACHFLWLFDEEDYSYLQRIFMPLATCRIFQTITIPEDFVPSDILPEAERVPSAPYDEEVMNQILEDYFDKN